MFRNTAHLRQEIGRFGLNALEANIVALARPAVQMIRTRVDEDMLPLGASKLGGHPDLPAGFEWPRWGDKPLTFIGQFKLSEIANAPDVDFEPDPTVPQQLSLWDMDTIPSTPRHYSEMMLPDQGMLYFFYDIDELPAESGGWRVFFIDDERDPLVRILHPTHQGLFGMIEALPPHRLVFERGLLPPPFAYFFDDFYELISEESDDLISKAYWDLLEAAYSEPHHHFYGYPWAIYNIVEEDIVRASHRLRSDGLRLSLEAEVTKWQFLFQINSDESLAVRWGDSGTLFVAIPKTSLTTLQFEDCWTLLQSR